MRHFTAGELSLLLLAGLLSGGGLLAIVNPPHVILPGNYPTRSSARTDVSPAAAEEASKTKARVYGIVTMLAGLGLGALVFYPKRRWPARR